MEDSIREKVFQFGKRTQLEERMEHPCEEGVYEFIEAIAIAKTSAKYGFIFAKDAYTKSFKLLSCLFITDK